MYSHLQLWHLVHLLLHCVTHLLLVVLNKGWFHHVDPVLSLNFIAIMEKEGLVTRQFLLDRLNWHSLDRLTNLESVHSR